MTSLQRWNPFKPLARLNPMGDFDDMFRTFGMTPSWRELEMQPEIRIDVSEDNDAYHVKAEIPGVEKNDIELSVDGRQVTIAAELRRETERTRGETELHSERYYGKARRMFTLPGEVNSTKVQARYDKGVLSVTLPKKSNGHDHRIQVA